MGTRALEDSEFGSLRIGVKPRCCHTRSEDRVEHVIVLAVAMIKDSRWPGDAVLQADDHLPLKEAAGASVDLNEEALGEEGL